MAGDTCIGRWEDQAPDERIAIDQSRDTRCVAIAAIITATIALAFVSGSYLSLTIFEGGLSYLDEEKKEVGN